MASFFLIYFQSNQFITTFSLLFTEDHDSDVSGTWPKSILHTTNVL